MRLNEGEANLVELADEQTLVDVDDGADNLRITASLVTHVHQTEGREDAVQRALHGQRVGLHDLLENLQQVDDDVGVEEMPELGEALQHHVNQLGVVRGLEDAEVRQKHLLQRVLLEGLVDGRIGTLALHHDLVATPHCHGHPLHFRESLLLLRLHANLVTLLQRLAQRQRQEPSPHIPLSSLHLHCTRGHLHVPASDHRRHLLRDAVRDAALRVALEHVAQTLHHDVAQRLVPTA